MLKQSFDTPTDIDHFWEDYNIKGIKALFDYGEPYRSSNKMPLFIIRLKKKYGFLIPEKIKNIIKKMIKR